MGNKNIIWNDYISQKERFADFFNGAVFDGKEIVCPENLTTLDSKLWRRDQSRNSYHEYIRDNVKLWEYEGLRYILSLEPEDTPNSALPVKYMNYESIQHDRQYKKIVKKHRKKNDLLSGEYVSGFSADDKLIPIVTMGIYLGAAEWLGHTHISDITGIEKASEEIRRKFEPMCNDFHVNLFDIHTLKRSDMFRTDLREVFGFMIRQNNREELERYVKGNEKFRSLSEDAYNVISVYSGNLQLDLKREEYETKEGIDMYRALQEMIDDGRMEGHQAGIKDGIKVMSKLVQRLLEDGREEELYCALRDTELQEELMKAYGIC